MLTKTNEIRLLDFGISKHVFRSTDSTHTKMNYSDDCVAPEQILLIKPNTDGKKHVAIGTHTDIYALGLLMYRLIAGHLPESHEAFIINLEEISQQHRKALNKGEEGLFGKVGGINQQETDFLAQSFIDLAEGIPVTFLYDDDEDELDDDATLQTDSPYHALAERFAEFVAELLDKRYQHRPNAKSALHWIENMQFKLDALDKNNNTVIENDSEQKQASVAVSNMNEDTNQTVFIPPAFTPPKKIENSQSTFVLPEKNNTNNTNDKEDKNAAQDIPIIPRNWPIKRLLLALGVILLAVNAWLLLRSEPEQPFPETNNTGGNTQGNTQVNTPVTNTLPMNNTPHYQPPKISQPPSLNREKLGDDTKKWAEVIPKLKRLAEQGKAEASALLAHAYHYGKSGETDWGKAWHYYQQALQQDSEGKDNKKHEQRQQALEVKASQILTDTHSPAAQRKKAYQVMEVIAKQDLIPVSINARLWMEYRYRIGDGVTVNHARADAWKKKYNAIKDEMP
jgi:serine/threonine protein kinase